MTILKSIFFLFSSSFFIASAFAGGIGDYKSQKHGTRERVNSDNCDEAYVERCTKSCSQNDVSCKQKCEAEAKPFCEERESKRTREIIKLGAKAATLAVGVVGVLLDDEMPAAGPDGEIPISPYSIFWNRFSVEFEVGGGALTDYPDSRIAVASASVRQSWFGFSGYVAHMRDKTDFITESDVGPTLYLGSASIIAGFQPSLVTSHGNGVKTQYGVGLRTPTKFILDDFFFDFNPLLYYMNRQWGYQIHTGISYRLTPFFHIKGAYEGRDIVDLNDLDVSTSSLQAVLLEVGFRLN